MSWLITDIETITTVVTKGTTPSTYGYEFTDYGVNYIRAEGISKDGYVDESTFLKISEECNQKLFRSQLKQNDILFSIAGMALGKTGIVKEDYLPANTNQAVAIIRPKEEIVYSKFLQYYFINPEFYKMVNSVSAQSAQPNINLTQIKSLKINLPPLQTQKRIASILSAYDDFIENNLKRIKLLEETAQNIYKEWFVNFRFPNYENTPFNDETGLPEGWEIIPFSKCADFINGFAFKPHHHSESGLPIIKIKELKNGLNSETPRYKGEEVPEKYFFTDDTILFSWSADINVYWWANGESILNQHLFKVVPFENVVKEHFYFGLKNSVPEFLSRANGATMKHIKRGELDNVNYTKPNDSIAILFQKQIIPILQQLVLINSQNQKLKEARDILLPRLMNRTIEV